MGMAGTFRALSDRTRREILGLLAAGPMTAGEIVGRFPMTGATVSHHLSVLRQAGLVSDERHGKNILYELNMTMLDEIMRWTINLKERMEERNDGKTEQDARAGMGAGASPGRGGGGAVRKTGRDDTP